MCGVTITSTKEGVTLRQAGDKVEVSFRTLDEFIHQLEYIRNDWDERYLKDLEDISRNYGAGHE